jgi:hypothetical protein
VDRARGSGDHEALELYPFTCQSEIHLVFHVSLVTVCVLPEARLTCDFCQPHSVTVLTAQLQPQLVTLSVSDESASSSQYTQPHPRPFPNHTQSPTTTTAHRARISAYTRDLQDSR